MERKLTLRIRITHDGGMVLGPGRADLLQNIQTTGSIAAAGRQMKMSYKRAWALVEAMNQTFDTPLVEAMKGGTGGGGARLTPRGVAVLAAYRGAETAAMQGAKRFLDRLAASLTASHGESIAVPPPPESG